MANLQAISLSREAGFNALFENSTIATLIVNRDRQIEVINPSAEKLFGYERSELSGKLVDILVPEDLLAAHMQQHADYYASPIAREMAHGDEVFARKKDGSLFPVLVNLCSYNSEGEMYVIAFVTDLTERKKAAEKNSAEENRIRFLLEHTPAAIAMLDTNMNYLVVSRRWLEDFRLTDQNIIGKYHYDIFPDLPDKWKEFNKRALKGEIFSSDEDIFELKDGTLEWLKWEVRPWYEINHKIGGIIIFSEVITERKRAEEKFFKVFHASPAAIILSEPGTGKIFDANESYCKLVGYSKEELIGKTSRELGLYVHSSDRKKLVNLMNANYRVSNYEVALLNKQKETVYVNLSAEFIEISGQKQYLSTLIDISARKKAEEVLKQNEERYRQIFNGIEEVFMMQEIIRKEDGEIIDLRFLEVNPATERLLKKTRSQIIGHLRSEFLGPMNKELKDIVSRVEAGENIRYEQYIPALGKWFNRSFDSPKPGLLGSINIDITESKLEEEALTLLAEAGHRLWLIDNLDEGLEEILAASMKLLHADKGDLQVYDKEKRVLTITCHRGFNAEFLDAFREVTGDDNSACGRALKTGSQVTIEDTETDPLFEPYREIARKSGFRSVQSTPMYASDGSLIGVISTHFNKAHIFDMKQLRRMELYALEAESFIERFGMYEAIQKLNVELEEKIKDRTKELIASLEHEKELNEIKSRFVSTASHEFRTPLSVILSSIHFVESYNKPGQEEKRMKHIERIKTSVKNLTDLLNDLLSLEKLEQGKMETASETFNLREFCEDLTAEMIVTLKKGQQIELSYEGANTVSQDKRILRNSITNLLSNASKYSPENKKILFRVANKNKRVRIDIKDEGMGIPEPEKKNIFSKFYRASNAGGIQGTGLGLNIVKKYVELLNGEISFISRFNEGSIFTITFPQKT